MVITSGDTQVNITRSATALMSGASSKKRLQHTAFWGLGVGLLLSIAGALASPCRAQGTPRPTTVVLRTEAAPELRELADATGRLIRM